VRHYRGRVLGIDLELSALFAVGRYRKLPVAALAVVSMNWGPQLSARTPPPISSGSSPRDSAAAAAQWDGDHA
jgi:hypothetical protein